MCATNAQVYKQRSEEYGPIYKETFGAISTVVISDLDEYDKVIAVDGRYPNRIELMPVVHYRKKRGMGLGTVNGSLSLYASSLIVSVRAAYLGLLSHHIWLGYLVHCAFVCLMYG